MTAAAVFYHTEYYKCEQQYGKGNCEWTASRAYPKCKSGFGLAPGGTTVCYASCPAGWGQSGTDCFRPNPYDRGVGKEPNCASGLEKNGKLCYNPCKSGYHNIAGVCWQNCPSQMGQECAAGCATNAKECGMTTFNMISAPVMAAISIGTMVATMGSSAAVSGAVSAGGKAATSVGKLSQIFNSVKGIATSAKGSVQTMVGGAKNFDKLKTAAKVAGKMKTVLTPIGEEINNYSKEFADNFDVLVGPEIAREVDSRFTPEAAYQIKREWGIRHLELNLEANGISTAKALISAVSAVDPTGLVNVVEAFLHPICKGDTPFPNVGNKQR